MSDLIRIVDLEITAKIGVPDEERRTPQRLLVSLDLTVDSFLHAAAKDDIARTLDYYHVTVRVTEIASLKPRKLLETLAEDLASDLLKTFPIRKIGLEIKKFILPNTKYVSVIVERFAAKS
jgi:dihydroneopterin aldolase